MYHYVNGEKVRASGELPSTTMDNTSLSDILMIFMAIAVIIGLIYAFCQWCGKH